MSLEQTHQSQPSQPSPRRRRKWIRRWAKGLGVGLGIVLSGLCLDMVFGRSFYHPLVYPYHLANQYLCQSPSLPRCSQAVNSAASTRAGGMIVSEHAEATRAGLDVLKQGGNAVDAAIAVGYALAVVDPCCGNLGGGGFMLIRFPDGNTRFINFRETAPQAATATMFQDAQGNLVEQKSREGYLAVGVPGTVAGFDWASRYGSLPRQRVIAPALRLATQGFALQASDLDKMQPYLHPFTASPNVARIFLRQGKLPIVGEVLTQPDLAKTLQRIADQGQDGFYRGQTAQQLVAASQANGGILAIDDFSTYQVSESPALQCRYHGHTIVTAPLPGGGVTLCQMLALLEPDAIGQFPFNSKQHLHRLFSAMLFAFADRNQYQGDPAFVSPPVEPLLSTSRIQKLNQQRQSDRALDPTQVMTEGAPGGTHTAHYSVVDKNGMTVSVTYTINSPFGAKVIAGETGFFLNNEMDDFTAKPGVPNQFGLPQSRANAIAPGKRPLSSMAPTIVLKDDRPWIVTGSPGGSTIPTTVLHVITRAVDFNLPLHQAVSLPRAHYQGLPNVVLAEPGALSDAVFLQLWESGYRVIPFTHWGAAESIEIVPKTTIRQGVNDPRRPGGLAEGER